MSQSHLPPENFKAGCNDMTQKLKFWYHGDKMKHHEDSSSGEHEPCTMVVQIQSIVVATMHCYNVDSCSFNNMHYLSALKLPLLQRLYRYAPDAECKHPIHPSFHSFLGCPSSYSATLPGCCMRTRYWSVTGYYVTPVEQKPPSFHACDRFRHWLHYT